jgi:hypothetical protein
VRSTPQLPLATPKVDPEKIIRQGKTSQEGSSAAIPSDSGNFLNPSLTNLVDASHFPITPSVGASRSLNFGSFTADFPSPSIGLEGFDTPVY